jgi:hypothetical protein
MKAEVKLQSNIAKKGKMWEKGRALLTGMNVAGIGQKGCCSKSKLSGEITHQANFSRPFFRTSGLWL